MPSTHRGIDELPPGLLSYRRDAVDRTYFGRISAAITFEPEEVTRLRTGNAGCQRVAFADANARRYRFAGNEAPNHAWSECPPVLELRREVERLLGTPLNYALVNLYRDGDDSLGAHSDDTRDLVRGSPIVGVSFGASRDMLFRAKAAPLTYALKLRPGSVFTMSSAFNRAYTHAIPKRAGVRSPRLSVTFRNMRTVDE